MISGSFVGFFLIRRSFHFYPKWRASPVSETLISRRSFATQQNSGQLPWLMLSSPTNPRSRYFYDLGNNNATADTDNKMKMRYKCEINLPSIAGHHCVGSSDGLLITVHEDDVKQINVINPLTGFNLSSLFPSPSLLPGSLSAATSSLLLLQAKAVLSPSLQILLLLLEEFPLIFARAGDTTWTSHSHFPFQLDDCIFHKDLLYGVDSAGSLAIYDLDNPTAEPPKLYANNQPEFNQLRKSLVESPDGKDLFMVLRGTVDRDMCVWWPYRTTFFQVFKLDQNSYRWIKVESLGDLAFFVGHHRSLSLFVSSSSESALRPNSIYFTDYWKGMSNFDPENMGDTGVYDLGNGSFHFFQLKDRNRLLNYPPPVWFMPSF